MLHHAGAKCRRVGDAGYVRWTENYGEPPVTFYSSQGLPMHMLVDAGSARPKSAANANARSLYL